MDEGEDSRSRCKKPTRCYSAELIPEVLGMIFSKLTLKEMITVIPMVCKSWEKIMEGPQFWQEIDIMEWSDESLFPENVDMMIQSLVRRSRGTLRKLCVSKLFMDHIFVFIAHNASCLEMMRLVNSNMSDGVVVEMAGNFRALTALDLCNCWRIGARGLEAMGKNCPQLESVRRTVSSIYKDMGIVPKGEAMAIAENMPNLKYLEIGYEGIGEGTMMVVENMDIIHIIEKCLNLEFLDVSCCWEVCFEPEFFDRNYPRLKVSMIAFRHNLWRSPFDPDQIYEYENSEFSYSDDDQYSDSESFDEYSDSNDNFYDDYSDSDIDDDDYSDSDDEDEDFGEEFDLPQDLDDYFLPEDFEDYFDLDDSDDDFYDEEKEESVYFVDEYGQIHLHL